MFSEHGKQDNSRKNSLNNENLFSFYSKKNKHLEVCRTGATKPVTFVKVTPSKRKIIYPEFKEAFCHVRYFLHQIQDF